MRGVKPKLTAIEGGLSRMPPVPSRLDRYGKDEFRKAARELIDAGILAKSDLTVLELYAVTMAQVRKLQPIANKEPAVVRTASGSVKTNPVHTQLNRYITNAKNLAAELGLTPASRHRKGIKKPELNSDDPWSAMDL